MSNSISYKQIIQQKECLSPNITLGDINESLKKKIVQKIEGKCCKNGYVKKGSTNILSRSIGQINSSHFSGNIIYNVKLEVEVCNPKKGDQIECVVLGINKMGIMCKSKEKSPLLIALSKIHHQEPEKQKRFISIKEKDQIKVEVICSKFELNDTEINVIAELV